MKYHINAKGDAGKCTARAKCPFSEESSHYSTAEAARAGFEREQKITVNDNVLRYENVTLWQNGPGDELLKAYQEGDCWVLAYALHERFGYDVYTFGTSEDDWSHAVVQVNEDTYLDITGAVDEYDISDSFGEIMTRVPSENLETLESLQAHLKTKIFSPYPRELAFHVAGLLQQETI